MQNITFVGAHNDDAEIWAGGTLLSHLDNGDRVHTICRGHGNLIRKEEQQQADALSGFNTQYYATVQELREAFLRLVPDVVITHWDEDSHPDHRQVAVDVLQAVKDCRLQFKKPTRFLFCDTYNKQGFKGEFLPTEYIDISNFAERKRELIRCFTSQNPAYWIDKVELLTRLYGSRCSTAHAEGFRSFSLLGSAFSRKLLI